MSLANQVVESFNNAAGVALSRGMIVRSVAGARQAALAQANTLANLASIVGVANNGTGAGGFFFGVTAGEVECLLETGLTPVAGQTVYVSASVAGRGTTAAPTLAIPVGMIISTARYAGYGTVTISLFAFFAANSLPDANWDPTLVRYFFVDNENGNDANVGFIDAAPLTVFTPAQTTPVALRTEEELRNRIPRSGASRTCVALFRPRSDAGNYRNKAGANDYLDVNYDGYRSFIFRGSDLTNSTNDQFDLGGVIDAAGPNADGSWTATGTVGFTITNAAGALPVENSTTGRKFQFKGNVTASLRTKSNTCLARLSGTTLDVMDTSNTAVPAAGDEYFLMYPGVRFTTMVGPTGRTNTQNARARGVTLAGLRFTSALSISWPISPVAVFLKFDSSLSWNCQERSTFTTSYTVEDLSTSRTISNSIDATGSCTVTDSFLFGIGLVGHSTMFLQTATMGGIYANGLLTISPLLGVVGGGTNSAVAYGFGGTGIRAARLIAGATMNGSMRIDGVDLSASSVGLTVTGRSEVSFYNVTGNPAGGVAFDLSACAQSRFYFDPTVTSTGTSDILLAGGVAMTLAGLAITNVVDQNKNDVQGSAGHVVDACKLVNNSSGGALAIGDCVRSAGPSNTVTSATGTTAVGSELLGVMVTPPGSSLDGYMVAAGTPVADFDAAPTVGAIAYLSVTTIRKLTTTIPPVAATNQKLRVGRVIQTLTGNTARVTWHPENLSVLANGAA